ncbi:MAG: hypothetical protein GXY54_12240 [Deltaproteobacteria bacterium]|nr:hypothetical protein [Deltaproteobacteria bacterium]
MAENSNKNVTIDGIQYNLDDLNEKAKANLASLQITEREIARLQQLLAIAKTARNAYAKVLKEELPKREAGVQ